jgi:hypothetical protein
MHRGDEGEKNVRNYLSALLHRDPDAIALIKATIKEIPHAERLRVRGGLSYQKRGRSRR